MKSKYGVALMVSALMSTSAFAQTATPAAEPAVIQQSAPAAEVAVAEVAPAPVEARLPANTEVILTLNEAISTKSHRLGDKFSLTVDQDVTLDGHVVIPRGTRALGHVTRRSSRGGFGKSGKMDVAFRYLDMNGRRIPLEGQHRQEGEGKTGAAIGAMVAAGLVGGMLVKGKSARIEEGREFRVRTLEDLPVALPAVAGSPAVIPASYTPARIDMTVETDKQRKAREKAEKASGKKRK